MEYFQKPIVQCPTGHSICSKCKLMVEKCPYCSHAFTNTRNFALENMLSSLSVQCKNESCTKIIPLHNYIQHVNQDCAFRNIKCKHPTCTWSDNKLLVNDHIKTVHKSILVQKFAKLMSHQFSVVFIEHNDNIFFVHRYTEDRFLIWTAEPTVRVPTKKLYLIVKIINATGECNTLKQPVSSYMENSERAKEKSMICMLKSKAKGCEFQLSIEED